MEYLKKNSGVAVDIYNAIVNNKKVTTEEMTEREESEVEYAEEPGQTNKEMKSQDIFVDKPKLPKKSKSKRKSPSYVVRSTKRLFKTLSFKQKPSSSISVTSSKNVQVSLAPTFDSANNNAGIDDDDDALSHMSPHDISEMMKEQEEHRLQTEEGIALPPSQALQRLLTSSSSSSSSFAFSSNVMMSNVMMYAMLYVVLGIVTYIYYNNKYLYEVLFSQDASVLGAAEQEENPHDWQDIAATWL
jgi:hypothetical protein